VFPCRPGAKEPATPHGHQDASTDPARISSWWRQLPDANVAIATGTPGPDVLDVDVRPEGSGLPALQRVRLAGLAAGARALVRTPSGGLHLYYAGTAQGCGRLPACWLDFKASGGYVLAPPSQVAGRPYVLAEHRPADGMIRWAAIRSLLDPPRPRPQGHAASDPGALAAWVAELPEGNRNAGLFWACCRAAEAGRDLTPLVAAAVAAGLPPAEAERTAASAARRCA